MFNQQPYLLFLKINCYYTTVVCRYWNHLTGVQDWFKHHQQLTRSSPPLNPASLSFREEALARAQQASHHMLYYWHQARYWASLGQGGHSAHPEEEWPGFVPPGGEKQAGKRSCSQGSRNRRKQRVKKQRLDGSFTEGIVLDFDSELMEGVERGVECHMEITPELLEFFAHSAKHRIERGKPSCCFSPSGFKDYFTFWTNLAICSKCDVY